MMRRMHLARDDKTDSSSQVQQGKRTWQGTMRQMRLARDNKADVLGWVK